MLVRKSTLERSILMRSLFLASLLALASLSPASATLLSTLLLPGGSLSNANITIDDFSFTRTCGGVGICAPLDASGVDVTLVGNQVRIVGGFTALNPGGGFASADFIIGYDIASVPLIGAVGLLFNGAVVGDSSFAQVVETVLGFTPFLHVAGTGQVDAPGGPLADAIILDKGYHALRVVKDLLLVGADSDGLGYATVSFVDQFMAGPGVDPFCVDGTCDDVPEPGTYALLGSGLIGLYAARRHRKV